LAFDVRGAMGAGCELVFSDKWDSEQILKTIVGKRVTHMHLVPIMFQRLLSLPQEVKDAHDISQVLCKLTDLLFCCSCEQ
jgi:long-chain acyl-CoA synthetase